MATIIETVQEQQHTHDRNEQDRNEHDQPEHDRVELAIPEPEENLTFAELGLSPVVLDAVRDAGYTRPTPIQREAIPVILRGRDVMGLAQTGTGKTAAFTLPLIDRLAGGPRRTRALVLTPTRELCAQVEESVARYSLHAPLDVQSVYGGVAYEAQERALRNGVDVVVATPGRLIDHLEKPTGCWTWGSRRRSTRS